MDKIELSDIQGNTQLADVKLSSLSLSADKLVSIFNKVIDSDNAKLPLSGGQIVGSLLVGNHAVDEGTASLAVGNGCLQGSYNYYWKAIDVNTADKTAKIWLGAKQPNYPGPFVCFDGDHDKIKIGGYIVDLNDSATLSGLSASGNAKKCWQCAQSDAERPDYNQLCADLGADYATRSAGEIQAKLKEYVTAAFSADDTVKPFIDNWTSYGKIVIGQQVTMVNDDKISQQRAAKVLGVEDGSVLNVQLTDASFTNFSNGNSSLGYEHSDSTLVFIDQPQIPAPAFAVAQGAVAVGASTKALRDGTLALGKKCIAEGDFSESLGGSGNAKHYYSFLWSPKQNITTHFQNSFHIGIGTTFDTAQRKYIRDRTKTPDGSAPGDYDIYVVDKSNKCMFLPNYVAMCISASPETRTWIDQQLDNISCYNAADYSNPTGYQTSCFSRACHTEGMNTSAGSSLAGSFAAHAEGIKCRANHKASHAEGECCVADQVYSHAGGLSSTAAGYCSFAHGLSCTASGKWSIALGRYCQAVGNGTFVWNPNETYKGYGSAITSDNMFCVNPAGGVNGFYIGTQTLSAIIKNAVEAALNAKGL